jgi:hypothetical protein
MQLRATKGDLCVYAGSLAELAAHIAAGWDIEHYVVGLGWVM